MSSSPLAERIYTADEYLALERAADHRSELINGRIYAMTGASFAHNRIVRNLIIGLGTRLGDGPCEVFSSDMRVKVSQTGMYTYPDVVGLCDSPQQEDAQSDTLLNPAVIIEVLSPSTQAYDRVEKFAHYRRIDSLREYIVIAQDQMLIEYHGRQGERWVLDELSDATDILRIETLGCEISLREIYKRVDFPPAGSVRWPRPAR